MKFGKYVCGGDSVTFERGPFLVTIRLEYDQDTRPNDFDCYSEEDIQRWRDDEWFYGGLVASVSIDGVELDDHAASLWGIDCNFGNENTDLDEVAADLLGQIDFAALSRRLQDIAAKAA